MNTAGGATNEFEERLDKIRRDTDGLVLLAEKLSQSVVSATDDEGQVTATVKVTGELTGLDISAELLSSSPKRAAALILQAIENAADSRANGPS